MQSAAESANAATEGALYFTRCVARFSEDQEIEYSNLSERPEGVYEVSVPRFQGQPIPSI